MKDLRESGNMKIGKLIYENFELCVGFGTVLDQK